MKSKYSQIQKREVAYHAACNKAEERYIAVEIRASTDRIYDSLSKIQEKIFALTDDLSPHAGLKVIANLRKRR